VKRRADRLRAQARVFCLALSRYLARGVLPLELLDDAAICVAAAAEIEPDVLQ